MAQIDFSKFTKPQKATVPVVNNRFQYHRKKYEVPDIEDGWYEVEVVGNKATILDAVFLSGQNLGIKPIKGYTYNNMLVFQNFDVGKRKTREEVQVNILLNNFPTFSSVEVIPWEDHNFYSYQINYQDSKIYEVKAAFDSDTPGALDTIKGITPELRTVYLFHDIQRQQVKQEAERVKKYEEKKEWLESLPGRIHTVFTNVGAKVVNYELQGKRAIVDWEMEGFNRRYNSVINTENFHVIEAGFCLSGHDKEHSVTSIVKLAEMYEDEGLTYITRDSGD